MSSACGSWIDYWSQDEFWKDSQLWKVNAELFLRYATSVVDFRKDDVVLDVGCGPGYLEPKLAPMVKKIHAVDVAEQFVDICRRNCEGLDNVSVKLLGKDYTDLSVCGGPFSLILCVSVVQYYRDIGEMEDLIASARRIVCPGGRMLIADLPRERGPIGFAWDALCSFLHGIRGGYARILISTALSLRRRSSPYKSFRKEERELYFTISRLEEMIRRMRLDAEIIKTSLSIYAHRPSLLIRF